MALSPEISCSWVKSVRPFCSFSTTMAAFSENQTRKSVVTAKHTAAFPVRPFYGVQTGVPFTSALVGFTFDDAVGGLSPHLWCLSCRRNEVAYQSDIRARARPTTANSRVASLNSKKKKKDLAVVLSDCLNKRHDSLLSWLSSPFVNTDEGCVRVPPKWAFRGIWLWLNPFHDHIWTFVVRLSLLRLSSKIKAGLSAWEFSSSKTCFLLLFFPPSGELLSLSDRRGKEGAPYVQLPEEEGGTGARSAEDPSQSFAARSLWKRRFHHSHACFRQLVAVELILF